MRASEIRLPGGWPRHVVSSDAYHRERADLILAAVTSQVRPASALGEVARITGAPRVCFGKPCVRGHRIWVALILDFLASGMKTEEMAPQA